MSTPAESAEAPLRFLADVNLGRGAVLWLRASGYDTVFVRDIDPRMSDTAILDLAVAEGRIVITMDTDFGELIYRSGKPYAGIVLLRMPDAGREEKIAILHRILSNHADELSGHFVVYKAGRLRIRRRPPVSR
jgi:predicted nuclease of predicted toxin-antitoxin system